MGTERARLTLATFDCGQRLALALNELSDCQLGRDHIGLAALESAIPRITTIAPPCPLLTDLTSHIARSTYSRLVTTSAPFWQRFACFGSHIGDPLVVARWMPPRLRDELTGRIVSGAVVLGVAPVTLSQQTLSARIMLAHSSARVQTHEFSL
jgi:hypothetical protein